MYRANWSSELRLLLIVLAVTLPIGFYAGLFWPTLALVFGFFLLHWSIKLYIISQWLINPRGEPPEARGAWGQLFDGIYRLQRQDREKRERLRSTVTYMRDSLSALRDGVVMIDPRGNIEWNNSAAANLLGLNSTQDTGQPVLNLLRAPEFVQYFEAGDYSEPLDVHSPSRSDITLRIEITNFGRGSKLLFAKDTTKIVQLEKMRTDFVANVSHELRTPLTVISGYLQTMIDNGMAEEGPMAKPLRQMLQQAGRMDTLLEDLLWLSKLESLEESAPVTTVNLSSLLSEIKEEAMTLYPDKDIELIVESKKNLQGNFEQLHSAVSNLVLNALKYSGSDEAISLRCFERNRQLCIEVIDRGVGIDPVHIPRLTERFYRADRSRNSATGGTGLGLAIVKHVLIAHNAELEIDSVYGKGSTFRCVFPVS